MMLIDTSVFVAAMIETHQSHENSRLLLEKVKTKRTVGLIATHSLAEIYAILSVYPVFPRLPPAGILEAIQENILSVFTVVSVTEDDYEKALARVVERRLLSGAIYDSLIYQAAVKGKAKALYTWDQKDFTRLSDGKIEIRTP